MRRHLWFLFALLAAGCGGHKGSASLSPEALGPDAATFSGLYRLADPGLLGATPDDLFLALSVTASSTDGTVAYGGQKGARLVLFKGLATAGVWDGDQLLFDLTNVRTGSILKRLQCKVKPVFASGTAVRLEVQFTNPARPGVFIAYRAGDWNRTYYGGRTHVIHAFGQVPDGANVSRGQFTIRSEPPLSPNGVQSAPGTAKRAAGGWSQGQWTSIGKVAGWFEPVGPSSSQTMLWLPNMSPSLPARQGVVANGSELGDGTIESRVSFRFQEPPVTTDPWEIVPADTTKTGRTYWFGAIVQDITGVLVTRTSPGIVPLATWREVGGQGRTGTANLIRLSDKAWVVDCGVMMTEVEITFASALPAGTTLEAVTPPFF